MGLAELKLRYQQSCVLYEDSRDETVFSLSESCTDCLQALPRYPLLSTKSALSSLTSPSIITSLSLTLTHLPLPFTYEDCNLHWANFDNPVESSHLNILDLIMSA